MVATIGIDATPTMAIVTMVPRLLVTPIQLVHQSAARILVIRSLISVSLVLLIADVLKGGIPLVTLTLVSAMIRPPTPTLLVEMLPTVPEQKPVFPISAALLVSPLESVLAMRLEIPPATLLIPLVTMPPLIQPRFVVMLVSVPGPKPVFPISVTLLALPVLNVLAMRPETPPVIRTVPLVTTPHPIPTLPVPTLLHVLLLKDV